MHILKIIHGYPPAYSAGSETYSKTVCDELSRYHRVSVFTREENPYVEDFSLRCSVLSANYTVYYCNNPQGKDGFRHCQMDDRFARLIDDIKPDMAYIGHLNHLSTGLIDVLSERRIPIVFMLHDFWLMCPRGQFLMRSIGKPDDFSLCDGPDDKKCALNCYEVYFSGRKADKNADVSAWTRWCHSRMDEMHSVVRKVDLFIAPSRYLKGRFMHYFGLSEAKVKYLDYGFPLNRLQPMQKLPSKGKEYTFGYIGTHIPAKGVNLLIKAFASLKGRARLKIFGRDNGSCTAALRVLANTSGNPIEFCGEYTNCEIAQKVFSRVDAIVVPSIWAENSPLVIHEAQACHIPVITADYGGMSEYVHHHENGLLFRHRDVAALTEQMKWAMEHPEDMGKLGARGYLYTPDGRVPDITDHRRALESIFDGLRK